MTVTMLRLHLRVWLTGPLAPAAGGLAALVLAAALLALWASIRTGIPILNITVTMLLPLALGGSAVTTILLPARPCRRRVVAVPVAAGPAPGATAPRPVRGVAGRGATYSQPASPRLGQRPAAANRVPPPAAAGPAYRIGRATVPGGAW